MIFYRYLKLIYSFSISCNGIIEMLFIRTSGSQMCKVVKNTQWWLPDNYFYVLRGYVQWSPGTKSWTKWHMTDDKLIAGLWYHKRAQLSDKKNHYLDRASQFIIMTLYLFSIHCKKKTNWVVLTNRLKKVINKNLRVPQKFDAILHYSKAYRSKS